MAEVFDVAEVRVVAGGVEVDRILLARVNPNRFVRRASTGHRELGDRMRGLGAALVLKGSCFSINGSPDTPIA
jgi:hypothetical protein